MFSIPIDAVIPYVGNARTHSDAQISQIAASIREFGWTNPILIDAKNTIIAGHGRLQAARMLGMTEVPAIRLGHLTKAQQKALNIADNRIAMSAGWDLDLLSLELSSLEDDGFNLDILGFDEGELDSMFVDADNMGPEEPADTSKLDDSAPPPPKNPVARPGDVWLLNAKVNVKHRLIVGDSTDAATLDKLLGKDVRAAMLVTSPPYWAKQAYDDAPGIQGAADFCARVAEAWASRIRRRIVINTGTTVETSIDPKGRPGVRILLDAMWTAAMSSAGWDLRNRRVWVKSGPNPNTAPHIDSVDQSWETMLTYWRAGHTEGGQERVSEPWSIAGFFDDIKGVGKDVVGDDHPCPYPVELPRRFILLYSKPGDVVAEPFAGSGTTILAGELTGRSVHASELSPAYVDVAILRWQELTGVQAILEATGETFDEVRAYRVVEDEFEELDEPEDEEDAA
jgi:DNA modification methylase